MTTDALTNYYWNQNFILLQTTSHTRINTIPGKISNCLESIFQLIFHNLKRYCHQWARWTFRELLNKGNWLSLMLYSSLNVFADNLLPSMCLYCLQITDKYSKFKGHLSISKERSRWNRRNCLEDNKNIWNLQICSRTCFH